MTSCLANEQSLRDNMMKYQRNLILEKLKNLIDTALTFISNNFAFYGSYFKLYLLMS